MGSSQMFISSADSVTEGMCVTGSISISTLSVEVENVLLILRCLVLVLAFVSVFWVKQAGR